MNLAKQAYEAYAKNLKDRVNRTVPEWKFLEDYEQKAWIAAVGVTLPF